MSMFSRFFDWLGGLFSPANRYLVSLPASGCRLYVGNLSYSAKEEDLKKLFSKYGRVQQIRITRRLKGYAFVEMPDEDAKRAVELNGTEFLGRKIVVSEARSKGNQNGHRGENNHRDDNNRGEGRGDQNRGKGRSRRVGRSNSRRGSGPTTFKGGKDKPMLERYE